MLIHQRVYHVISKYIQVYPSISTWNIPWYPLKYTVNIPLYHIPVEYPSWIVKSSEIMHFQHLGCLNVHSGWFKWFKSKCVMVKVPISSHFPVFLMVKSAFFTTFGSKISSKLRNRRNQRMACRRTSAASMKVIGAAIGLEILGPLVWGWIWVHYNDLTTTSMEINED